jgi:predicted DNA binding CopG/RHH family protein
MKDENDLEFLKRYADVKGLQIDEIETQRFKSLLSDSRLDLRLPQELKETVKAIAEKENIPYQRLIKNFIIDGVSNYKKAQ